MAVDYRTALLDQLDPTQQRKNTLANGTLVDTTTPESPATAPKWTGGETTSGTLTPVPGVTGPLTSDPSSPNVQAAVANATKPLPTPATTTASNTVYHPDKNGIFGFETSKLADPNKSDAKYTPAAKTFSQALGSGLQVTRGNMDAVANNPLIKAAFPNAKAVGDDKVDFGDGNGPIDLLGADAKGDLITFQNGGGGGTSSPTTASTAAPAATTPTGQSGLASALQGDPYAAINSGLSAISGPSQTDTLLQSLLAQLRGGQ